MTKTGQHTGLLLLCVFFGAMLCRFLCGLGRKILLLKICLDISSQRSFTFFKCMLRDVESDEGKFFKWKLVWTKLVWTPIMVVMLINKSDNLVISLQLWSWLKLNPLCLRPRDLQKVDLSPVLRPRPVSSTTTLLYGRLIWKQNNEKEMQNLL